MSKRIRKNCWPCILLVLATSSAWSQQASPGSLGEISKPDLSLAAAPFAGSISHPTTLKQVFDAAWLRQPEAQSKEARQQAASARRLVADSWTAEPAALELATKTDRLNNNQGNRELEAGLAIPLWLPGERTRTVNLADAEMRVAASRVMAAQLRTAASVRESYWLWQRTRIEQDLSRERLINAQQFAADVARRVKAGDLARADQHQADGAVATAEAELAEAISALAGTSHQLRALSGIPPGPNVSPALDEQAVTEPVPEVPADFAILDTGHPAVVELLDRAAQSNWPVCKRARTQS